MEKFAEFKDKTGAEVIHLEVEFDSTDDEDAEFFISSVFIGTDL